MAFLDPSRVQSTLATMIRYAGVEAAPVSHGERLISTIGGMAALYILLLFERSLLGETGAAMLVASMGASAVLLFAVPHGALSQPWCVLAGHGISAFIGVSCAKLVADPMIAGPLAVGLAIGGMHYLRAIHPPGGATALTAVTGGPQVAALGYEFVVHPVLINAIAMIALAVGINAWFSWRRYPGAWGRKLKSPVAPAEAPNLTHADFMASLARIGTFVDISEQEFLRLRELMREAEASRHLTPADIKLGRAYSNGVTGPGWGVRRVVDEDRDRPLGEGRVIWRSLAGPDRDQQGISTRADFAKWAAYEVVRSDATAWSRATADDAPGGGRSPGQG